MSGATGSGSTYLETAVLGHSLGFQAWPMPVTVYVGLSTTQPSNSIPGTEIIGNGYARRAATFGMQASSANVAINTASVEFPAATAAWGVIGWFELWDAATAGNRLYQGTLIDPNSGLPVTRAIQIGDILRITAGALAVTAF